MNRKIVILIISMMLSLPIVRAENYVSLGSIFSWLFSKADTSEKIIEQAEQDILNNNYDVAIEKANKLLKQKNLGNEKTAHTRLVIALANYYLEENEEAIKYFDLTLEISGKLKDQQITLRALDKKSLTYYWQSKYPDAIKVAEEGLKLARSLNDQSFIYVFLFNKGRILSELKDNNAAIAALQEAVETGKQNNISTNLEDIHNKLGIIFYDLGRYKDAIEQYRESQKIYDEKNDKEGKGISYNNIGNVYRKWGDYQKAIENINNALKIFEEMNYPSEVANCMNNIGVCYENLMEENLPEENLKNLNNALQYHQQALEKRLGIGDTLGASKSYLNLGNVHSAIVVYELMKKYGIDKRNYYLIMPPSEILAKFKKALEYYDLSYSIKKKNNDFIELSGLLSGKGRIYVQAGMFDRAMVFFNEALVYAQKSKDKYQEAFNYREIGVLHLEKSEFESALEYFEKSNKICIENNFAFLIRYNFKDISQVFEAMNMKDKAYIYYKKYIEIKDQQVNEEKYKQLSFMQTRMETDRKDIEIKLLKADQEAQADKMKYMRRTIYMISFAVLVFIVLSFMLFKFFRDKKKANIELEQKNDLITSQNDALEKQNELISHQKEEITDSIKYASKIQTAVIPDKATLDELFKDYFVLFQPRDIVSGDFYYATEHDSKIIVAAADCTGHGVPGAFMSMLGVTSMKEIIKQDRFKTAADILDNLREYIINAFHQDQKDEKDKRKDGMDIGLLIIEPDKSAIQFAGAFNGAILIRNDEAMEINADRMPVGAFDHIRPFSNQIVEYKENDVIYLFSDGYADQFGGPKEKKFMHKNFRNLLLEINHKPMQEQKEILWRTHLEWRGQLEQIDDIIVIGIRLNGLA